jgi:hypothetical protein
MPSDNRNAWRLPIIIFAIFIILIIITIIFIVLGYTSVDYDEVIHIFVFCDRFSIFYFLVWCNT